MSHCQTTSGGVQRPNSLQLHPSPSSPDFDGASRDDVELPERFRRRLNQLRSSRSSAELDQIFDQLHDLDLASWTTGSGLKDKQQCVAIGSSLDDSPVDCSTRQTPTVDNEHVDRTAGTDDTLNLTRTSLTWDERERDIEQAVQWIQQQIRALKQQDRCIVRQLLELRANIHSRLGVDKLHSFTVHSPGGDIDSLQYYTNAATTAQTSSPPISHCDILARFEEATIVRPEQLLQQQRRPDSPSHVGRPASRAVIDLSARGQQHPGPIVNNNTVTNSRCSARTERTVEYTSREFFV